MHFIILFSIFYGDFILYMFVYLFLRLFRLLNFQLDTLVEESFCFSVFYSKSKLKLNWIESWEDLGMLIKSAGKMVS